jgi:hypothetical protein
VNQQFAMRGKVLHWQAGYGVVSFGTGDLEWVKQYIQNQRAHHASGKVVDRLERITELEAPAPSRSPLNGADSVHELENKGQSSALPGVNAGPITASRKRP